MNKVLIVESPHIKNKEKVLKDVTSNLKDLLWHIFDDELNNKNAYKALSDVIGDYDLIVTLGGDGAMLKVAELAAKNSKPIIGINYGGLGYLTSLKKDDVKKLQSLRDGKYKIDERTMLEISIKNKDYKRLALNDVVICKSDINVPIKLDVKVDKDKESYFADGLIIATPTGSTAYSYSAGGKILKPNEHKLIITPVAPVLRKNAYKVCNDDVRISIKSIRDNRDTALLSIDGFKAIEVDKKDLINIKVSKYKTRIIRL